MLAMALLLHGGLLGGMGGEAAGVDGFGEGAWTLAAPAEGFLAASGTRELILLSHLSSQVSSVITLTCKGIRECFCSCAFFGVTRGGGWLLCKLAYPDCVDCLLQVR